MSSFKAYLCLAVLIFIAGPSAFAAGYESSIPFGALTAGVAGIGTPYVQGSQALFFNPAGLTNDKPGQDLSLNLSPGWGNFKGPVGDANRQESGSAKVLFPYGLMYARDLNEKLAVGVGSYASGGSYADFQNLDIAGLSGKPELKSNLSLIEVAAGVGYKVTDNLKIGLAWRVVMANADFSVIDPATGRNTQLTDLKDTQFNGYKLGAQYKLGEKTNFGFTYRSEVNFKAKGNIGGTDYGGPTPTAVPQSPVTVRTLFPAAGTLGVAHQLTDTWKVLGEYVITQYSKVTNIAVDQSGQAGSPLQLQWKDQHEIRLAGEYSGWNLPLRFGYIWSSQVTNQDYAAATFTPPGAANTLTLGSGTRLAFGTQSLQLNGGLEYGWSRGNGTATPASYELKSYGIHMGADYTF